MTTLKPPTHKYNLKYQNGKTLKETQEDVWHQIKARGAHLITNGYKGKGSAQTREKIKLCKLPIKQERMSHSDIFKQIKKCSCW